MERNIEELLNKVATQKTRQELASYIAKLEADVAWWKGKAYGATMTEGHRTNTRIRDFETDPGLPNDAAILFSDKDDRDSFVADSLTVKMVSKPTKPTTIEIRSPRGMTITPIAPNVIKVSSVDYAERP